MRTAVRWAFRLLILLLVLLVAGFLLLDTVARKWVEHRLQHQTGLEVKIGKVNVGLLHAHLTIENLVIYNSAEFGGSPFIDIAECYIEYDLPALRSGKLHAQFVRFNLAAVNFVEDKSGRRNSDVLQNHWQLATATAVSSRKNHSAGPQFTFTGIDLLNLSLGKATYLCLGQPEKVDEFNFRMDHQVFISLDSEPDFSAVLFVALLRSGVNLFPVNGSRNWLEVLAPPKN